MAEVETRAAEGAKRELSTLLKCPVTVGPALPSPHRGFEEFRDSDC